MPIAPLPPCPVSTCPHRVPCPVHLGQPVSFEGFPESLARMWCLEVSRGLRSQTIEPDGIPYLVRYFAAGWNPFTRQGEGAIYLHHFVGSDPQTAVHSHPWTWGTSLVLVGGYREERCTPDGTRTVHTYHPGEVNVLAPGDRHRVDLLGTECWTLFLAGRYGQPWAFFPRC
jgi:hypothetical protein